LKTDLKPSRRLQKAGDLFAKKVLFADTVDSSFRAGMAEDEVK
jgi:hypothetical protein